MPSRVNKRGVLALSSVERFNGLAQLALSDVFACAKPRNIVRKVLSFMNNLLEVSSPLWLVVAAFALPFILGNFSLFLSNLRNAFRRKKQKSARETTTSLLSVGKKAVGMGVVFAGFLLATPPETVQSAEPTITDAYIAYSYHWSKRRYVHLDAKQEVWIRQEIYRRPFYNAPQSTGKRYSRTEISGKFYTSYRSRSGNTYESTYYHPYGALGNLHDALSARQTPFGHGRNRRIRQMQSASGLGKSSDRSSISQRRRGLPRWISV